MFKRVRSFRIIISAFLSVAATEAIAGAGKVTEYSVLERLEIKGRETRIVSGIVEQKVTLQEGGVKKYQTTVRAGSISASNFGVVSFVFNNNPSVSLYRSRNDRLLRSPSVPEPLRRQINKARKMGEHHNSRYKSWSARLPMTLGGSSQSKTGFTLKDSRYGSVFRYETKGIVIRRRGRTIRGALRGVTIVTPDQASGQAVVFIGTVNGKPFRMARVMTPTSLANSHRKLTEHLLQVLQYYGKTADLKLGNHDKAANPNTQDHRVITEAVDQLQIIASAYSEGALNPAPLVWIAGALTIDGITTLGTNIYGWVSGNKAAAEYGGVVVESSGFIAHEVAAVYDPKNAANYEAVVETAVSGATLFAGFTGPIAKGSNLLLNKIPTGYAMGVVRQSRAKYLADAAYVGPPWATVPNKALRRLDQNQLLGDAIGVTVTGADYAGKASTLVSSYNLGYKLGKGGVIAGDFLHQQLVSDINHQTAANLTSGMTSSIGGARDGFMQLSRFKNKPYLHDPFLSNVYRSLDNPYITSALPQAPLTSSGGLSSIQIAGPLIFRVNDFATQDGDIVRVSVNTAIGTLVNETITLTNAGRQFSTVVPRGVTSVSITALNEGQFSPNTGQVTILGNIVFGSASQQFNLLTGQTGNLNVSGR